MTVSIARPDWTIDAHWQQLLSRADRLSDVDRTAAHAEIVRIYTVDGQAICAMNHQATWSQSTWAGRLELLEQGHAAAFERLSNRFIERMRHPGENFGATAELNARQMIRRSGAHVMNAPKGVGRGLAEFVAEWSSGVKAIVEVKALQQGIAMHNADRVVTLVHEQLMQLADRLPGVRGRLEWSPDLVDAPPSEARIAEAVRDAIEGAEILRDTAGSHRITITGLGTLELTADTACPELRMEYATYGASDEVMFGRLRRPAEKAMRQFETHPHLPGILVLDVDACGLARNGLGLLEAWAEDQHQLGVIIVVEREHARSASYGNVRFLHGPRVAEVMAVADAFEFCDAGHIHYQPLCTPASPCESLFWLSQRAA